MYLSHLPGIAGVALAIGVGYGVRAILLRHHPGETDLAFHLALLVLGLYGLTFDRCEVPGLIASYRANVRDFVYALGIAFGEKPVGVERTRRLCVFIIPVAFAPFLGVALSLFALAFDKWADGEVSRAELHRGVVLHLAVLVLWAGYARLTARLRLRPGGGYGGMDFQ